MSSAPLQLGPIPTTGVQAQPGGSKAGSWGLGLAPMTAAGSSLPSPQMAQPPCPHPNSTLTYWPGAPVCGELLARTAGGRRPRELGGQYVNTAHRNDCRSSPVLREHGFRKESTFGCLVAEVPSEQKSKQGKSPKAARLMSACQGGSERCLVSKRCWQQDCLGGSLRSSRASKRNRRPVTAKKWCHKVECPQSKFCICLDLTRWP